MLYYLNKYSCTSYKKTAIKYAIILFVIFLVSCQMTAALGNEDAFSKAVGNRSELLRVLRHYEENGDPLKFRVASFLIGDMANKGHLTDLAIDEYYAFIDSVYQIKQEEYDILIYFVSYISWAYLQRYETITTETSRSAYLIPRIALTVFIGWNIPQFPRMLDPTGNDLQERNYEKADHRHPEDVQLRYLYAASIQTGHHSQADSILKSLAGHYPKHSLYRSAYAWRSYQQGDTATALNMMAEAIRYTPRLIAGKTMIRWRGQDSLFYHRMRHPPIMPVTAIWLIHWRHVTGRDICNKRFMRYPIWQLLGCCWGIRQNTASFTIRNKTELEKEKETWIH